MSWDILIINSNKPVDFEKEEWPAFKSRQLVIDAIQVSFPDSVWNDLSWGVLNKPEVGKNSPSPIVISTGGRNLLRAPGVL